MPTPDSGPVAGGTQVAVEVPGVTFTSLASNSTHTLAIGSDGGLYTWGPNTYGSAGNGTEEGSRTPSPVTTPPGVTFAGDTTIAAGYGFSLAIGSDGNTYAWGHSAFGQMGNGESGVATTLLPTLVTTPPGVTFTSVSAGSFHALAIGSDGNTYAWGQNVFGQLGNGSTSETNIPTPVTLPPDATFTSIDAGNQHSLALDEEGNAYSWGYNYYGQLGNGSNSTNSGTSIPALTAAPPGLTFSDLIGGSTHSVAIASDGTAYAWGDNTYGELGNGTENHSYAPTPVIVPPGVTFTRMSAGYTHSVAVGSDGNLYTWGLNRYGALGNEAIAVDASTPTPTLAPTPPGVTFTSVLSSEASHRNFAAGSDGKLYAWGYNSRGLAGTGSETDEPVLVPTPVVAETVATSVTFDDLPGTDLARGEGDTWTVVTPAHEEGPVDVVISWAFNGVAGAPITHAGGFTYVDPDVAPTITDPEDQVVKRGEQATFTVETTGNPSPAVTWEVSTDGGTTWTTVAAGDGTTLSADGRTLTVTTTAAHDGFQYRATATNAAGEAVSDPALLTVQTDSDGGGTDGGATDGTATDGATTDGSSDGGTTGPGTSAGGGLAQTGAPAGGALLGAGLALLAVGAVAVAGARRKKS